MIDNTDTNLSKRSSTLADIVRKVNFDATELLEVDRLCNLKCMLRMMDDVGRSLRNNVAWVDKDDLCYLVVYDR